MAEDIIVISDDDDDEQTGEPGPKKVKHESNGTTRPFENGQSNGHIKHEEDLPKQKVTARKRMSSFTPKLIPPVEISLDIDEKPPSYQHPQYAQVNTQILSFLHDIKGTMNDVEYAKVKSKLLKRMAWIGDCDSSLKMDYLLTFLVKSSEKVVEKPTEVFNVLKKLLDEFAKYQPKSKVVAKIDAIAGPSRPEGGDPSNEDQYKLQKKKAHIKRLELALKNCGKEIKRLEEEEMSIEDLEDEDSNYIKLDRYKKRYMKLLRTIDKLRNVRTSLNRKCDKRFVTESSRIPEVNSRIMELVNKERRFPDYADILGIYKAVNDVKGLGYSTSNLGDLAKQTFVDVGKQLKSRRFHDDQEVLNAYIPEEEEDNDPAKSNDDLKESLKANHKAAAERLNSLLEEFAQKQMELKEDAKEVHDDSPESEPDSEDEEEDEENEEEIP